MFDPHLLLPDQLDISCPRKIKECNECRRNDIGATCPKCSYCQGHLKKPELKTKDNKKELIVEWYKTPRRVYGAHGVYYIISRRLRCSKNLNHDFAAHAQQVQGKLPLEVQNKFPAFLTQRSGVDKKLIHSFEILMDNSMGPASISNYLQEQYALEHSAYFGANCRKKEAFSYDPARHFRKDFPAEFPTPPDFSSFKDPAGYNGSFPSGESSSSM